MTEPEKVLIAGDWHGNGAFATAVIDHLPDFIPNGPRILLHVGDFGIWPGDAFYLSAVDEALEEVDAELWFVDGNHECHDRLTGLMQQRELEDRRTSPYRINSRIKWLPRGYRWQWHGRTWLALGGATSVDRPIRTPGRDWWPQESISYDDFLAATSRGKADVMVTHDCPKDVPLPLPTLIPHWWELGPAEEHRRVLRQVALEVKPEWLFHGHYHLYHDTTVDLGWGDMRTIGLDCDGAYTGQSVLCDVRTMEITNPWQESHG